MLKTANLGLNKYAYGESVVSDHPDPAKRQAPDDSMNHNWDVLDRAVAEAKTWMKDEFRDFGSSTLIFLMPSLPLSVTKLAVFSNAAPAAPVTLRIWTTERGTLQEVQLTKSGLNAFDLNLQLNMGELLIVSPKGETHGLTNAYLSLSGVLT